MSSGVAKLYLSTWCAAGCDPLIWPHTLYTFFLGPSVSIIGLDWLKYCFGFAKSQNGWDNISIN